MVPILNHDLFVVDSWPLLEKARRRTQLAAFDTLVQKADNGELRLLMSEINLGEVFYLLEKDLGTGAGEAAVRAIHAMPIEIIPLQPEEGMEAARLKARYAVSYADCFRVNLAIRNAACVLTGDPEFLRLSEAGIVHVKWLGA